MAELADAPDLKSVSPKESEGSIPSSGTKYYRYDEVCIDSAYEHVEIYLTVFDVIRYTPKGVWLDRPYGMGKRFVLKEARKQFASPTKELALKSFRARKMRQISIYTAKLKIAKLAVTCEPKE